MSGPGRRLEGRAAAPGAALGPAFVLAAPEPAAPEATAPEADGAGTGSAGTPEEERARLDTALEAAGDELAALAERVGGTAGADEAAIFEAQAAFAADPELYGRATGRIDEGAGAEEAVREAFGAYRDTLAASDNEYLAARAGDLDDVRDRVVRLLSGRDAPAAVPEEPSVVVAHELTPSQTAELPREQVVAIATETGSSTSHAAILARALGIPAVVGVSGLLDAVEPGTDVAVDGDAGTVVVGPDDEVRAGFEQRAERARRRREELAALADEPGRTADGRPVELAANIAGPDDLPAATEAGAEGSGLVRTEFLFLDRDAAPDVDEQTAFYRRVLDAFPGRRVVLRTLDIGADKPMPFVRRDPEPNPALGVRGIRLSLADPRLFRDQLRALLRAGDGAEGRLAVMFPMVARVEELLAAREVLDEVAREERLSLDAVEVGAMLEVPAAALAAGRLAAEADFLSLGTNDLLQYLFAADRLVDDVADLPELLEPEVLGLVGDVVAAVHAEGAWIGVCGEAAADVVAAAALVGLGVDELSMTPAAIPEVKQMLRSVTARDLEQAVAAAREERSAAAARARIAGILPEV